MSRSSTRRSCASSSSARPPIRRRGKAKCIRLQSADEPVKIICDASHQPCEDDRATLMNYLGILARDNKLLPQNFKDWGDVHAYHKDRIWDMVKVKFNFWVCPKHPEDPVKEMDEISAKHMVIKSLNHIWREARYKLKKKYFDENLSKEQNINRPVPIELDKAEWIFLVEYWTGDGAELSEIGKNNRASQRLIQRTGRKGYSRVAYEYEKKNGERPGTLKMLELTQKIKGTEDITEEASIIKEAVERTMSELQQESDGEHMDQLELERRAFEEVLGPEHPGHVRFFGNGAKKRVIYGSNNSRLPVNSEVLALRREIEELKRTRKEDEAQEVRKLREENEALKQSQQQMQQLLQRVASIEQSMTNSQANARN